MPKNKRSTRYQKGTGPTANSSDLMDRYRMANRLGTQFNGKRDMYSVLGYQKRLLFNDYYDKYDRQNIAGRIVDAPSSSTWRNIPEIKEEKNTEKQTEFEQAWENLSKNKKVMHYLDRTDRLAGIGHYAVLVIGVRGKKNMKDPLEKDELNSTEDIIFLSPFSEKSAMINEWERDTGNPRFGLPRTYLIDLAGDFADQERGKQMGAVQEVVHHTRVIHVAEGLLEDEVFGRPRLKRVMNLLNDLEKVVGGSAEMFWQGAYMGVNAKLDPNASVSEDEAGRMEEEMDEFYHGLRRYIRTQGIDMNQMGGQVADPKNPFDVIISLIAGATNIPKRVLLGSERGELASSQDETNWNNYISERQETFAEPMVLRPLIDRLIWLGALPEAEYDVEWPDLFALDEQQKADVMDKKASAIQKTAPMGDVFSILSGQEIRSEVFGMEEENPEVEERAKEYDMDEGSDDVDVNFRSLVRGEDDQDE